MHTPYVGISFYIGSPVISFKFRCFRYNFSYSFDFYPWRFLFVYTTYSYQTLFHLYTRSTIQLNWQFLTTRFSLLPCWKYYIILYIIYRVHNTQVKYGKLGKNLEKWKNQAKLGKLREIYWKTMVLRENSGKSYKLPFNLLML